MKVSCYAELAPSKLRSSSVRTRKIIWERNWTYSESRDVLCSFPRDLDTKRFHFSPAPVTHGPQLHTVSTEQCIPETVPVLTTPRNSTQFIWSAAHHLNSVWHFLPCTVMHVGHLKPLDRNSSTSFSSRSLIWISQATVKKTRQEAIGKHPNSTEQLRNWTSPLLLPYSHPQIGGIFFLIHPIHQGYYCKTKLPILQSLPWWMRQIQS